MNNKETKMRGIFDTHMNDIFECKDLEACKNMVIDIVSSSKIKAQDKAKILYTTRNIETVDKLHQYIVNSYFQFNGLKVIA